MSGFSPWRLGMNRGARQVGQGSNVNCLGKSEHVYHCRTFYTTLDDYELVAYISRILHAHMEVRGQEYQPNMALSMPQNAVFPRR